jgi:hypothetical protein
LGKGFVETVVTAVIGSIPTLLIILGVALLLLGMAGGVRYHSFLPITGYWQFVAAAAGVALCVTGLIRTSNRTSFPKATDFNVAIASPADGERVANVTVRGTIKTTKLPSGYTLRVFRHYPNSSEIAPMGDAVIRPDGTWKADNCNIGGNPGDPRGISVYLVGPSGSALLDYFERCASVHKALMRVAPASPENRSLPAIKAQTLTQDMILCTRIDVYRS